MTFWLDLKFGSDVGLMPMLVIIATALLISFYAGHFIYKVSKADPNE